MISKLKMMIAKLMNGFHRRKGLAFHDQCMKVIMHTCSLQLEREETRDLAPTTGATGPIKLSGGAITKLSYRVFDTEADKIDESIRKEPWRAFAEIAMTLSVAQDPYFVVTVDGKEIEVRACHKAPGLAMVKHLSTYFPLLPKPHAGPIYKPVIEASS